MRTELRMDVELTINILSWAMEVIKRKLVEGNDTACGEGKAGKLAFTENLLHDFICYQYIYLILKPITPLFFSYSTSAKLAGSISKRYLQSTISHHLYCHHHCHFHPCLTRIHAQHNSQCFFKNNSPVYGTVLYIWKWLRE